MDPAKELARALSQPFGQLSPRSAWLDTRKDSFGQEPYGSPTLGFNVLAVSQQRVSAAAIFGQLPGNQPFSDVTKSKVKVLLLEGISAVAVNNLKKEGFQVETLAGTLPEEELIKKVADVHVLGIRSRTQLTDAVLRTAHHLLAVGCFCIGTNQVDLQAASNYGVAVFNSPFSNSRSVAELIIGELITLSRCLGDRNREMHNGSWLKTAKNCHEIRGKTLGIVGYGHIGSQLSVLAESMGMFVIFYDVLDQMPLGNARPCKSLDDLLAAADFVTLHVPETDQTKCMIGKAQVSKMKKGSYLLNASRGTVVVIPDVIEALKSGHLFGAYFDVYPDEPPENGSWTTGLEGISNVNLSPHIGGSTVEAQDAIGMEVSNSVIRLIYTGRTTGAVNLPEIDVPYGGAKTHRVLHMHFNKPGVLREINSVLADVNVSGQVLRTHGDWGYMVADVDAGVSPQVTEALSAVQHTIRTRLLY